MNKRIMAALFSVAIIVVAATTWFFLNQTNNLNQTNKVRVTAFSIDPEGWENPGGLLLTCSFNITLHNMETNDVQGPKLRVKMFVNGSEIDVRNIILGAENGVVNDTLCAGEVREFRGELQYSLHQGGAIETIGSHPAGASYVAQVMLGKDILDESWAP
jgi:hypothetical protein